MGDKAIDYTLRMAEMMPGDDPPAGHLYLFAHDGSIKCKNSDGNVTDLAAEVGGQGAGVYPPAVAK